MTKKLFICYDQGCNDFTVEPFNPSIDWHNNEFIGTYYECMREKGRNIYAAYRFSNDLPAEGNDDTLMPYHY